MTEMQKKGRILSGMRVTGPLHLGNLVGALRNWASLQEEYECFYMVADYHGFMSEYADSSMMGRYSRECVADWVASGLDPERSTIFVQSHVPEHAELHLILSAVTPLGWLERCPTYKEALQESKKDIRNYAFLGYPVLQAADILVYKATHVPVGEDQLPHLELTREIARRFNSLYKKDVFPEPQAILSEVPRLLGLDRRKMSKSYENYIALSDEPEVIRKKVMSMITDPQRIRKTDPGHPDYCNVHSYYEVFAPDEAEEVAEGCREAKFGCTECKARLGEILVGLLAPIREKREALLGGERELDCILREGAEKAKSVASGTMAEVWEGTGFLRPK